MRVDGRELQRIQNELEVSPEAVCQEANVSMSTLYKVYSNKRASANSVSRVRKAIHSLKEKNSPSKAKTAG